MLEQESPKLDKAAEQQEAEVEGDQDYELDKVKIKKSEEINERKRLAKRARNSK